MVRVKKRWILLSLAMAGAVASAATNRPVVVVGESMLPTLRNGCIVWIEQEYYHRHLPRRGEVVVFRHGGETYVKRIYRGPGETMTTLMHDQECQGPVRENRAEELERLLRVAKSCAPVKSVHVTRLRVPTDCVYVLGDNPFNSEDSREFGPVPVRSLVGRVRMPVDPTYILPYEYAPHWGMPQFKAYSDGVSLQTLELASARRDLSPVLGHQVP